MTYKHEMIEEWRRKTHDLLEWKIKQFPSGLFVYVDDKRYTGHGISKRDNEPVDKLAVLLENGHTWWYPLEKCRSVKSSKDIPKSLRQLKRMYF